MSEPIKLNSGAVASLADTDRVVGCDSTGALRSISLADLLRQIRSSIHIGGRNLIPDSAKFTGWTAKQHGYVPDGTDGIFSVRKSTGAYLGAYRMMSFVAGATYTFSAYTDSPDDLTLYIKYVVDIYGTQTANFGAVKRASRQISQNWHQVSVTATCTKSGTALIEVESNNIPSTKTVRYCAPKLEIGNIPTDWSPAPEDLSGGVIYNHSIGYELKHSTVRKGGPHERRENTDRRSYTILVEDGAVRGIARRDNDERNGVPRIILQHRRVQISGNLWWKRGSEFRDIPKFPRHRRLALWMSGGVQRETSKNPPTANLRKWRCSREDMDQHVVHLEVDDILALGKEVAA